MSISILINNISSSGFCFFLMWLINSNWKLQVEFIKEIID
jgi:hypothetical protein